MTYSEAVSVVTELYYLHLGRAPDSAGLEWWANTLANGNATSETIAADFANSPEGQHYTMYLESVVQEIYWSELGRVADAPGLSYFVDALRRRTTTEDGVRNELHTSEEAEDYRASLPQIPQPDPRMAAMQAFNAEGNAIVEYRRGDSLKSLAQQAYGNQTLWWVIAQANNAMSDQELSNTSSIIIPDIRTTSESANAIQLDDNGQAFLYINRITGVQWPEYYISMVSTYEPIPYEPNPSWLEGLAFVNGNDAWNAPDYQFARARPYPLMPPDYWMAAKDSVTSVPLDEQLPINHVALQQLPVYRSGDTTVYPPPPTITSTPGGNPALAAQRLEKYPEAIQSTLRLNQVTIVAVKKSIIEYIPTLEGQEVPNWGGRLWDDAPGGFYVQYRVILYATEAPAHSHGSGSLFDHELAHAYDWAKGKLSLSPAFEAAFKADFQALFEASPNEKYYTLRDEDSTFEKPTFVRAQGEAYAESFANYYSGNARWFSNKPALLKYFKSLPRSVQPKP